MNYKKFIELACNSKNEVLKNGETAGLYMNIF